MTRIWEKVKLVRFLVRPAGDDDGAALLLQSGGDSILLATEANTLHSWFLRLTLRRTFSSAMISRSFRVRL